MTIDEFWQQDSATVTLYLSGIVFLLLIIGFTLYYFAKKYINQMDTKKTLSNNSSKFLLFIIARYLLVLLGGLILLLTFLPGLFPFERSIDQNLGLGGILLFFIWPLLLLQMGIGLVPLEEKIKDQSARWAILGIVYLLAFSIDMAAIDLVYDWQ